MPHSLRPYSSGDARTILSWVRSTQELEYWCGRGDFPLLEEAVFEEWHRDADITGYCLFDGAELVGYGETWLEEDECFAELGRLIVTDRRRGKGIGAELVARLCGRIERDTFQAVHVRVHPDNGAAARLYRRCGFELLDDPERRELNRGQASEFSLVSEVLRMVEAE